MIKNIFLCGIFAAVVIAALAFTGCSYFEDDPLEDNLSADNSSGNPSGNQSGNPSGHPTVTFTGITDFGTWLSQQPANTAAAPYNVKLNVNSLGGGSKVSGSVGYIMSIYNTPPTPPTPASTSTKYVNLDLSGSTITFIDNDAFQSCYGLASVILPIGVTEIKSSAFNRCYSLTSVIIPNSVNILGDWAFGNNTGLTSVTFQGTIPAANFSRMGTFFGDLRDKFYAANSTNGTPGTYKTTAPVSASSVWSKQ